MEEKHSALRGPIPTSRNTSFNQDFDSLPESVKRELQVMCVLYTEDVGGILTLEFEPDGNLEFKVTAPEEDYLFDEIGSVLKIKQYQEEKRELLESLELYYRAIFSWAKTWTSPQRSRRHEA